MRHLAHTHVTREDVADFKTIAASFLPESLQNRWLDWEAQLVLLAAHRAIQTAGLSAESLRTAAVIGVPIWGGMRAYEQFNETQKPFWFASALPGYPVGLVSLCWQIEGAYYLLPHFPAESNGCLTTLPEGLAHEVPSHAVSIWMAWFAGSHTSHRLGLSSHGCHNQAMVWITTDE